VIYTAHESLPRHAAIPVCTAWAWGQNTYGQLGDNTTTNRITPVQVSGLTDVIAIAAGSSYGLALKSDGSVWAWGRNTYGQLGNGTIVDSSIPVQVNSLTGVVAISARSSHSLAVKTDGTAWAWGLNDYGQLGDNSTTNRSNPVQVKNLTGVSAISAGSSHSLAIKADGTAWAWGHNIYGKLGDGTTTNRTTPVQVSGLINVTHISAGGSHSLAVKSDGTAWAWGYNGNGQLGIGSTAQRTTPTQVSNIIGVVDISAGGNHSLAFKSDGTIWAWGLNTSGQLGDNTTTQRTAPIQVKNITGAKAVSAGSTHSLAVKLSGTVLIWGTESGFSKITQSTVPVIAYISLNPIYLDKIIFDQNAYHAIIPTTGGPQSTITVNATALDFYNNPLPGAVVTYSLAQPYTGLSINSATGVVSISVGTQPGTVSVEATCEIMTVSVELTLTASGQLAFDLSLYYAAIPVSGNSTSTVSATATDIQGGPISWAVITYGLDQPYAGVSIHSATGVITISPSAQPGIVNVEASYNGLTATVELILLTPGDNTVVLNVSAGETYELVLTGQSIPSFNGVIFVVVYDPSVLLLTDFAAQTDAADLQLGAVPNTPLTIIGIDDGLIVFTVDKDIPMGYTWSGVITILRFKVQNTSTTVVSLG
jgi:hypothetical protein